MEGVDRRIVPTTVVDQAFSADPAASTRDNRPTAGIVGELEGHLRTEIGRMTTTS
jgi:hypothetical protein